MGNTTFKMSLTRQFKRGHMIEKYGQVSKSPYKIRNNRKLNKARKNYIQLVTECFYGGQGGNTETNITKVIRYIRHIPSNSR